MSLLESLRIAFDSIWSAKLRSFFTLLGIIVSVAFLVVVVAVIQGMNAYVKENLTGAMIGTNAFQVRRTPITVGLLDDELVKKIGRRPIITARDAETVRRALPDAEAVSLQSGWPTPINDVSYRNKTVGTVLICIDSVSDRRTRKADIYFSLISDVSVWKADCAGKISFNGDIFCKLRRNILNKSVRGCGKDAAVYCILESGFA